MTTNLKRQLLALPDRDTAEEVADEVQERWPVLTDLEIVRDSLAGEDDAEDAQWLVVLEAPEPDGWGAELLAALDELVGEYEGWREQE